MFGQTVRIVGIYIAYSVDQMFHKSYIIYMLGFFQSKKNTKRITKEMVINSNY